LKELKAVKQAISASALCKTYEVFDGELKVLEDIVFELAESEFMSISGASGSGKTTLLNIIGGLDRPTSGRILVFDEDLTNKSEDFLASFRCSNIGFVFQSYNLVSTLTVAENVAFPMEWLRKPKETIENQVGQLLEIIGLQQRAEHFPFQLSGGEQQRVAFARALANDPPLVLIDEPTGNLDPKTSLRIIQLLQKLKNDGKTIVVATHDPQIIDLADKRFGLENGKLMEENG
jgi:putative ABC transport system ATP-binding protein